MEELIGRKERPLVVYANVRFFPALGQTALHDGSAIGAVQAVDDGIFPSMRNYL